MKSLKQSPLFRAFSLSTAKVYTFTLLTVAFLLTPNAYAFEEYIKILDITVVEQDEGEVTILKIGRFSPLRRYSWFRVGDIIESVDGIKTTVYSLLAINENQGPHIKYRRGTDLEAERQISLEKPVYDIPLYVSAK